MRALPLSTSSTLPLLGLMALLTACGGGRADRKDLPTAEQAEADKNKKEDGEIDDDLTVALVETLIQSRAYDSAVPMLKRALLRRPNDSRLHTLMGTVLRDKGIYSKAEAEFKLALHLNPKNHMALSGLGMLYDLRGEYTAAKGQHLKAIGLAPLSARLQNNLGFSRFLAGDTDEAIKAYEEAISLDPSASSVYINLGFALVRKEKDSEALRIFRQVLDDAGAHNNLAMGQELRGAHSKAQENYLRALEINPRLKEATKNLERLSARVRRDARRAPTTAPVEGDVTRKTQALVAPPGQATSTEDKKQEAL